MSCVLDSSHRLKDISEGRVLALMNHAGFPDANKVPDRGLLLGALRVGYFQASVPTPKANLVSNEA
jgi:hypothetical protein